jgi:hypothetical protein
VDSRVTEVPLADPRPAHDQFAGQHDGVGRAPVDDLVQQLDGDAAHLLDAVRDDGEGRVEQREPLDVVERDDRDVGAHALAEPVEHGDGAHGHEAVGGEQRGRRLVELEQGVHGGRPAGGLEVADVDQVGVGAEAQLGGRGRPRLEPLTPGGHALRARDVPDALVAEVDQVLHGGADAGDAVGRHARHVDAGDRAVDEHRRHLAGEQRVDAGRVGALRGDDDAVDAARDEGVEVAVLLLAVLVGVAEQGDVAELEQRLLDGVGEVGEERVADVRHEQADRVGAGRAQRAGLGVRPEVELADGPFDLGPRLGGGGRIARQHARGRRGRDAGALRHVPDRHGVHRALPRRSGAGRSACPLRGIDSMEPIPRQ